MTTDEREAVAILEDAARRQGAPDVVWSALTTYRAGTPLVAALAMALEGCSVLLTEVGDFDNLIDEAEERAREAEDAAAEAKDLVARLRKARLR